jgi:hypothetical protein
MSRALRSVNVVNGALQTRDLGYEESWVPERRRITSLTLRAAPHPGHGLAKRAPTA